MPTTFNYSGKPAFMYDSAEDVWFQLGGAIDTAAGYSWTGTHDFSNDINFTDAVFSADGINNFLNPAARDAKFTAPVRGNICFVRQDAGGSALNQIQFYDGSAWVAGGDITAVTGGVGITATNSTGPIPSLAVDTALVATTSNTMTMSNKTLTTPALTNPTITGTTEIAQIIESASVTSYSTTGTVTYNVLDQGAVAYFTSSASSNWTLNLRGSSTTSLVNLVSTGESLTIAMLVTNGATAFYQSAMQIDGTAVTSVTKWQGGSAPSSGNASSVDIYSITAVKVANTSTVASAFTVFASQTKFA